MAALGHENGTQCATSTDNFTLDRRAWLQSAFALVGGIAVNGVMPTLSFAADAPRFFTPDEMRLFTRVADLMIPATDTPGALAAGVPATFDALMAQWARGSTQAAMRGVLSDIAARALSEKGKALPDLPRRAQHAWLAAYDANAVKASQPYRRFKQLLLTCYYLSEVGATKELRYELVPGTFNPALPLTAQTRTWAA